MKDLVERFLRKEAQTEKSRELPAPKEPTEKGPQRTNRGRRRGSTNKGTRADQRGVLLTVMERLREEKQRDKKEIIASEIVQKAYESQKKGHPHRWKRDAIRDLYSRTWPKNPAKPLSDAQQRRFDNESEHRRTAHAARRLESHPDFHYLSHPGLDYFIKRLSRIFDEK